MIFVDGLKFFYGDENGKPFHIGAGLKLTNNIVKTTILKDIVKNIS